MKKEDVKKLQNGLYRIVWEAGSSLGAIGTTYAGDKWLCCTNWTSDTNQGIVLSGQSIWDSVVRVKLLTVEDIQIADASTDSPPGKVYCGQCSYFEIQTHEVVSPSRTEPVFKKKCIHPFNMGTWENADELKNIPSEINKNNDCVWYLRKG
ncbi:MAG: hypothetical protein KAV87_35850 [Desulfobacteraceae bacterium]|nr:hypothetical protein [Desulfobacteraceae bacterium]